MFRREKLSAPVSSNSCLRSRSETVLRAKLADTVCTDLFWDPDDGLHSIAFCRTRTGSSHWRCVASA